MPDYIGEGIEIFIPHHHPPEVWERYRQSGYKLCRYLAIPIQQMTIIDAESFLLKGRDIFINSLVIGGVQDDCVLAKIFTPEGRTAYLKTDRDYFDICIRDETGMDTVATWQWAFAFREFRQDELWSNMADFLKV